YQSGPWAGYDKNGTKIFSNTYSLGIVNGPSTRWHDNGLIKTKGTYKDGKKDGTWWEYAETVETRTYKHAFRKPEHFIKRWRLTYKMGKRLSRKSSDKKISTDEAQRLKEKSSVKKN
ncbi:MAG: hypothetical protein CMH53_02450, partial [Myxococcales bacterium]|nr:hypothetical protein [Myxococcales bacterium]